MCGIVGILSKKKLDAACIAQMVTALAHRGPDDQGVWSEGEMTLGHTRLSIHDLSAGGHQPFASHSGRYWIVFNGEIYNYLALKKQLVAEYQLLFKTETDTEILVNAIECWGLPETLSRCVGMFAFAVWDRQEKVLWLARDRFGEKPLYFGQQNGVFAFASELKAFRALRQYWDFKIDRAALSSFLYFNYVPAPRSIFDKIAKLEPGTYARMQGDELKIETYWNAEQVAIAAKQNPLDIPYEAAVDQLEILLKDALTLQKAADVPVGAFLSGGIDSSAVVALMQSISSQPVHTFSIGFEHTAYDEAPFAKAVAQHLGTRHTECYFSVAEALAIIQQLPHIYDEPFGDSSQVPTTLVSQVARKSVTVSISGDAGDEIFGGYRRYLLLPKIWKTVSYFSPQLNRWLLKKMTQFIPSSLKLRGLALGDKLHKLNALVEISRTPEELYQYLIAAEKKPELLTGSPLFPNRLVRNEQHLFSFQEWMMLEDIQGYLVGDILTKVDRAGMSVNLETRVPFLDHRIFEWSWRLPETYKIHNGVGKRILRDVLYRYVPRELLERPKQGFGFPFGDWLRQDLRAWAEPYLNAARLEQEGFLDVGQVRRYWEEHFSGARQWEAILWNILMFETWLETWQGMGVH